MTDWRRSSRCDSANCLFVAHLEDAVVIFDSATGEQLAVSAADWDAFVAGVKAGEFDR